MCGHIGGGDVGGGWRGGSALVDDAVDDGQNGRDQLQPLLPRHGPGTICPDMGGQHVRGRSNIGGRHIGERRGSGTGYGFGFGT